MKLFELDDKHKLVIDPAAYALKPFAKLWNRDKTPDKRQALAELAYIYYMMDYKSDFFEISDEMERSDQIITQLDFDVDIDIEDPALLSAKEFYREKTETKILLLLKDAYSSVDKLRDYFREVDLTMVDDKGRVMHDSSKLMKNIANLGETVEGLKKLEFQVRKEKQADSKLRAGREKGMFEDDV